MRIVFRKSIYLTILLFTFFLVACGTTFSTQSNKKADSNWEVYKGESYRISYPKSWTLMKKNNLPSDFFLIPSGQTNPLFFSNLNLIMEDLSISPTEISIEDYSNATEQLIHSLATKKK